MERKGNKSIDSNMEQQENTRRARGVSGNEGYR